MDNAIVNKWYQSLEDKSVHSVFAAFRVKFNVELSCCEKILYNKIQKTVKKIYKLRKNKEGMQGFSKETFKIPVNKTNLDSSSSICNTTRSRVNSTSGFVEKRKQKIGSQS